MLGFTHRTAGSWPDELRGTENALLLADSRFLVNQPYALKPTSRKIFRKRCSQVCSATLRRQAA